MSNPYFGYQGFRPASHVLVPTLKPGETYAFRNNKFSMMGRGVAYPESHLKAPTSTFSTAYSESFSNVRPSDYEVPDRRGVSAKHLNTGRSDRREDNRRPLLHRTIYEDDFKDFSRETGKFLGTGEGVFREEFDKLEGGKGWVGIRDIRGLVEGVLGEDRLPWITDRILKTLEANRDGRIRWTELKEGLGKVMESARRDVAGPEKKIPQWIVSSRKVEPALTRGRSVESSYRMDMGKHGEVPSKRRIWYKTGMSSTTLDLSEGTTKDTYQIPGYCGFIPSSKVNSRAVQHADLREPRRKSLDLRLFHRHNTPGYTGHAPLAACNDLGPASCGADIRTTTGAAAAGLIL